MTDETFLFAADKPIIGECFIQYTEGATNINNVIFGFMDAFVADSLVDDGAGPKSSYSGMVIFKVDGDTVWECENSISTTQKTTTTTTTAGGAAFQRLRVEARPHSSTLMDVLFFVDDVQIAKHKDQVFTSATQMSLGIGVKNGAATTVESLFVDYMAAYQLR